VTNFVKFKGLQHNLDSMSTAHLADMHNEAVEGTDIKPVKRFADKTSAIRRTKAAVEALSSKPAKATVVETETAPAPAKVKKVRKMHFEFKPDNDGIRTVKSPESLRGRAVTLLAKDKDGNGGATLGQVKSLIEKFDLKRGKGNAETIDRRAYELVRIMHYYLGYGITKNEDGVITIYTK